MSQAATETPSTDTGQQADPALETPTQDNPQDTGDGDSGDQDGDSTDPRVQRANRQAAQYRTQLRETQQQLQQVTEAQQEQQSVLQRLAQALTGDSGEGDQDADPAEQVTALTGEVETLRNDNQRLQAELLVHTLASDPSKGLNANPVALLDSRSFTNQLGALDASADDYQDQVAEAIRSAVESNSSLRAGQGSRRGGAESAGRSGDSAVTQEQFQAMSAKDRSELFQTNPTLYRKLADAEVSSRRR